MAKAEEIISGSYKILVITLYDDGLLETLLEALVVRERKPSE